MPYAAEDRLDFIKRSELNTELRILDLGGMLSLELPNAISGVSSKKPHSNAVLMKPGYLPFRDSVFDAVVSYHYIDLIPPHMLPFVFKEVLRIMNKGAFFSFMVTLWLPQNEPQRSTLLFHELLKSVGAFYHHDFEEINRQLSLSFCEITFESVKREIVVPQEYVKQHLRLLGSLAAKEKELGGTGIRKLARDYFARATEHGEALLPAIHFTAKK